MKRTFLVTCKQFALAAFCFASTIHLQAQTTTGGLKGFVKDPSATIELTNTATNEKFTITPQSNGSFSLYNLTPANTYTLKIVESGVENVQENLSIPLGDNLDLGLITASNSNLAEVKITGSNSNKNSAFSKGKQGASIVIGKSLLQEMPAGSRGISDFIRLTPQSNGNSFAGTSNRFNNLSIDGAQNNDAFGLASGSGLPGGSAGTQPISLDAIQELQVILSPYNVTLGNFAGGGINAVTRSGSNKEEGSVYGFMKNNSLQGKDPINNKASDNFSEYTVGARLGGAIVKDKLFYFVNYEMVDRSAPSIFNAGDAGAKITKPTADSIKTLFRDKYNYNVGSYDAVNLTTVNQKLLVKLDYVLSNKHKLSLRHNFISASKDELTRSSAIFQFENAGFTFKNIQNSTVLELKSNFSSTMFNNLIIGYSNISDERKIKGDLFPSIVVQSLGTGGNTLGSDPVANQNKTSQQIIELTNNFKWVLEKHTLTFGTHDELFMVENSFANRLQGQYRISNTAGLWNLEGIGNSVNRFRAQYPLETDGQFSKPKMIQLGFYAQDEFDVNSKLNVTYGVRLDIPVFLNSPLANTAFEQQYGIKTNQTPSGNLLWSPRLGFKYQVTDDKMVQIRGGGGIFTGRVPLVWISNNFGNDGIRMATVDVSAAATINGGKGFDSNPLNVDKILTANPPKKSYAVNVADANFKFPQLLRGNLAFDFKIPGGIELTVEGIYSQTLNNIYYERLDFSKNADGSLKVTNGATPVASDFGPNAVNKLTTTDKYYNPANPSDSLSKTYSSVLLLKNTNKGYSYSITVQASKKIDLQTAGMLSINTAYTYGESKDISSGLSSVAFSNYYNNMIAGNQFGNNPPLTASSYDLRHRIIAGLNYRVSYAKNYTTTFAVFYSAISGLPYSLTYNGDVNTDGDNNDLVYIPTESEIAKKTAWTATERSDLNNFINSTSELRDNRGKYTERNGMRTPWEHIVDARFLQDISFKAGTRKHTVQLSCEIFNVGNLLNDSWGRKYTDPLNSGTFASQVFNSSTGKLLNNSSNTAFTIPDTRSLDIAARWSMQLGLRYIFN